MSRSMVSGVGWVMRRSVDGLHLPQQAPQLLPRIGAQLAVEIGVPIARQPDIGTDAEVDIVLDLALVLLDLEILLAEPLHEQRGAMFGGAEILQMQLRPVHLPHLLAQRRESLLGPFGTADESGIVGEVIAAHMDHIIHLAVLAFLGLDPDRQEGDVVGRIAVGLYRQHDGGVGEARQPFEEIERGQEELRLRIGLIDGVPVGPQLFQQLQFVDHINAHDISLNSLQGQSFRRMNRTPRPHAAAPLTVPPDTQFVFPLIACIN